MHVTVGLGVLARTRSRYSLAVAGLTFIRRATESSLSPEAYSRRAESSWMLRLGTSWGASARMAAISWVRNPSPEATILIASSRSAGSSRLDM